MEATGETGSNTRMGLGSSKSARLASKTRRQDNRKARKIDRTMEKANKSEEEAAKEFETKKAGVQSSLKKGREENEAYMARQQELQAVPKADEFENINLAEVYGL